MKSGDGSGYPPPQLGRQYTLSRRRTGGLHLCVDYRHLNEIKIEDRTPLPLIGESLDQLSSATIYTKLNIQDAYYNLPIAAGDEWKRAFQTRYGLYEYFVMPFGLTNAPVSFQQWMNQILSEYFDIFCAAYPDDILIFTQNLEDHRRRVRTILRRVEETGLMLKASHGKFHTMEIEYLGDSILLQGLKMHEEKIRTIKEWKEPTNVNGIPSFLRFANFYRWFIQDYSQITTPLTRLTRKEVTWECGDE